PLTGPNPQHHPSAWKGVMGPARTSIPAGVRDREFHRSREGRLRCSAVLIVATNGKKCKQDLNGPACHLETVNYLETYRWVLELQVCFCAESDGEIIGGVLVGDPQPFEGNSRLPVALLDKRDHDFGADVVFTC